MCFTMLYIENTGLQDCSGFLQIGSQYCYHYLLFCATEHVCNDFVVMVTALYNSLNNSCYAPHTLTYLIKWMTWAWLERWIPVDCCLAAKQQIVHLLALS